ncbi:MAG: Polysacc synt protein [Patescibacteria group bacterium]|nr:Polysacc synt protein [Patescibacteria group bacterium]
MNNARKIILSSWIYTKLVGHWNKDGLKKYFENTGWAILSRAISIIISFFITVYLVRYLGPENYGQLSYAISFVALFSIFASFGVDNILHRDIIKYPEKRGEYLGTAFVLKLLTGIFATILTVLSAITLTDSDVSKLVIFLLSGTFILQAFNVINTEFQADVKLKYTSIISLITVVILSLLKIMVIIFSKGIIYLGGIMLLEAIINASLLIYIHFYVYGNIKTWFFTKHTAYILMTESWPFIFIAFFASVYTRIDQVMLKHLVNTSSVGLYDAAVRLGEIWGFIPSLIVASMFTAIINAKKINNTEYRKRLLHLSFVVTVVSTIIATFIAIFSKNIVNFIYGVDFEASAEILSIYVFSTIFLIIGSIVQQYLTIENKRMTIFFLTLGTALLNISLNFILIPIYGIIGAAWATLISYIVLCYPYFQILRIK